MTRKDYQLIAEIVGSIRDSSERSAVTCDFCDALKAKYPNFDDWRFISAVHAKADALYGARVSK